MELFDEALATIKTALSTDLLRILFTAVVCILVAKYLLTFARKVIDRSHMETTMARFLKAALKVVAYFVVALTIANSMGFDMSSLVALASVVSAAFALAAQSALSNLFGGILMLATKPFVAGDYIIVGTTEGTVQEISLFYTTLNTIDNKHITVPNSTMSTSTITNCTTEGKRRVDLEINVPYEVPVEAAKAALQQAIAETDRTISEPDAPFVRLFRYDTSAMVYVVRVWTLNADYWNVYFDLLENIKASFDRSGIRMTYNHLIVHQEARPAK